MYLITKKENCIIVESINIDSKISNHENIIYTKSELINKIRSLYILNQCSENDIIYYLTINDKIEITKNNNKILIKNY